MPPKPRFAVGEKVLCYDGPLLYEAKCLKSQVIDNELKYLIHYIGWNKRYDKFVPSFQVLQYNERNLEKQRVLEKNNLITKKSKASSVKKEKKEVLTTTSEKSVKIKKEKEITQETVSEKKALPKEVPASSSCPEPKVETQPLPKQEIVPFEPCFLHTIKAEDEAKFNITESLKNWLIKDWELVTRQNKIVSLPARVTINDVIKNFLEETRSDQAIPQPVKYIMISIGNKAGDIFNYLLSHLPNYLLYKFERPQYAQMLAEYPDHQMSEFYGAIHLLRMFTKLGGLLTDDLDPPPCKELFQHLNDLLMHMSKNPSFFSLDDYGVPSPEYMRQAV